MHRMKLILFSLLCLGLALTEGAAHEIKLKFTGIKNVNVVLVHFHANSKTRYAEDTAYIDALGAGVFNSPKTLEEGIYQVLFPNYQTIEFIIGAQQQFEIDANIGSIITQVKFVNCPENSDYQNYLSKKKSYDSLSTKLHKQLEVLPAGKESNNLQKRIKITDSAYSSIREGLKKKYEKSFLGILLHSNLSEVSNASLFPLTVNSFKAPALLNTPYYESRLMYFLDSVVVQRNDSIEVMLSTLFNNSLASTPLFQYVSAAVLKHYREKKDAEVLYLYVAENFYIPFVSWDSAEQMENLQLDIARIKPTMVGSEAQNIYLNRYNPAPGYTLFTDSGFFKSTLYSIDADYLVVVFWNQDCDSCRKNILWLNELVKQRASKKVVLLSMNMQGSKEELASWLKFINDNSLQEVVNASPSSMYFKELYQAKTNQNIFVLDKGKRILARKLSCREVAQYLPKP